jgi:ABC-type proline/glycine betaine transport system permease subunit/glycine betaine/choline ABC-type transport system substrate-binding protein
MSAFLQNLPDYLGWHMLLSAAAMAVGIGVSVPLGIWASRRPTFAEYLLGFAGILQTVPTLAVLALMVPILNSIGFGPAFVALTLYSFLPILAATVTGLRGVDPSLIEAARGLGMSERQMLFRVQLPLASPIILSGIRTATVLVVGTATLASPVGGKSLGNYIFAGLNMQDIPQVIFGCIFTALLAILLDQVVHMLEIANARRSRRLAGIVLAVLLLSMAASSAAPIASWIKQRQIIVMGGQFSEQYILCELLKLRLTEEGFDEIDQRQGMGETIQFLGLKQNKADVAINYTGNVWTTMMGKKEPAKNDEEMYGQVRKYLLEKHKIHCLGKLGFKNNYVLVMNRAKADEKGIRTIKDLVAKGDQLIFADDQMFFQRPEWKSVKDKYKEDFQPTMRSMDPSLLYKAIKNKSVHVITAYSSDGRLQNRDLVEIHDEDGIIPTYDAILLVSDKAYNNTRLRDALMPLVDSFNLDKMKHANLQVDRAEDPESPAVAAQGLRKALVLSE